ncbi:MAG: CBS domain-containing protein [Bacillota bacterium]
MLVKEIMSTDPITVSTEDSVEKCARLLQERDISGLPVLDSDGNLVGIVTEGDLIRRASRIKVPGYLEILGGLIYLDSPKKFIDELQRAMALDAGKLMSKNVITVNPDDSLERAATLMVENNINRLPVVDENKGLVGIVSRRDIMARLYSDSGKE